MLEAVRVLSVASCSDELRSQVSHLVNHHVLAIPFVDGVNIEGKRIVCKVEFSVSRSFACCSLQRLGDLLNCFFDRFARGDTFRHGDICSEQGTGRVVPRIGKKIGSYQESGREEVRQEIHF